MIVYAVVDAALSPTFRSVSPGHSDDGVSFVVDDLCFSGDTLFR